MSTMNYNPANERVAFEQLMSNKEAKTAIDKLMQNANSLANQLEIDPQKIVNVRRILIKRGMTPEQADYTKTNKIFERGLGNQVQRLGCLGVDVG